MKRPYSQMSTTLLPILQQNDPRKFKSSLDGTYKLWVTRAIDISKPQARPVEEIDDPENEEEATEIKLNQTSARMMQLGLKDTNGTEINAIETERIDMLNNIKPSWTIYIEGPVELRCGNIMLEKKHVTNVEPPRPGDEIPISSNQHTSMPTESRQCPAAPPTPVVDLDDDEDPTIIIDFEAEQGVKRSGPTDLIEASKSRPAVELPEDWDDEFEDDDDCIIID